MTLLIVVSVPTLAAKLEAMAIVAFYVVAMVALYSSSMMSE
jgi:hypothetical protein